MSWEDFLYNYNIHLPSSVIDMVCGELAAQYHIQEVYRDECVDTEYSGNVKYKIVDVATGCVATKVWVSYGDGYVEDIEFAFEYLNQQELYSEFINNLTSIISTQMEKYLLEIFKIKYTTNEYGN